MHNIFPNLSINSFFLASSADLSISVNTTQHPSFRNLFAVAEPMPPAAPVIKATFPANSFSVAFFLISLPLNPNIQFEMLLFQSSQYIYLFLQLLSLHSLHCKRIHLIHELWIYFFAKDIMPYSGIKIITGYGSRRLGDPLLLFLL